MVRIKMKAIGGSFMWKKLGLSRPPSPSDSDDEAWDTTPPVPTSTETPPATGAATGRSDSPAVQTYRQRKRTTMIVPPPSSSTIAMETQGGEIPQEDTPFAPLGKKRPRTPSPPSPSHPEQETETAIAIHPAGHKETDAPSDLPTDMPTDLPDDLPSDAPSDLPTDLPTDAPSDMPSDLPSDLPRPTCPDHITQALTFNKVSEQTGLAKISSLPYHPGRSILDIGLPPNYPASYSITGS
ncbi:rxLR effector protein Htp1-like [Manihot esculenta]|uniref:rxLR effector protein Htp1-like n=1 Tax=Manihot esculenta TaxID=3983 RepID=UPI001CC3F283|nr:rxLR effector protein Htp1-like [Manihot esculenta]